MLAANNMRMMLIHKLVLVGAFALALEGCASLPSTRCSATQEPAIQDTLYFGTGIPGGGTVTAEDWSSFVTAVVTPRFPQGLTVSQAAGQWRGDDGVIVQESSYVLQLVHPGDAANSQAVAAVADAYKAQFRQEAVLRVSERVCISL